MHGRWRHAAAGRRQLIAEVVHLVGKLDDFYGVERALTALRLGNSRVVQQGQNDVVIDAGLGNEVEGLEHEADERGANNGKVRHLPCDRWAFHGRCIHPSVWESENRECA